MFVNIVVALPDRLQVIAPRTEPSMRYQTGFSGLMIADLSLEPIRYGLIMSHLVSA